MSARSLRARTRSPLAAKQLREKADTVAALLTLPFLDPSQAALIAQTSASTIRRACVRGLLPHVRVNGGKLIRVAPDDLRAWLTAGSRLSA